MKTTIELILDYIDINHKLATYSLGIQAQYNYHEEKAIIRAKLETQAPKFEELLNKVEGK